MLATNRSYDIDFYRRSGQAMNLVLSNQALSDGHGSYPYEPSRGVPLPELENKPALTHRKRVPVACERCRKRKIKCSGDQGNGNGCENCRSAGHEGCQFLRVRSEALQCHSTYAAPRWHGHHYHPYSRSHGVHQSQQVQQAQHHHHHYIQQHTSPYSTWQGSIDYDGLASATTGSVSWTPNSYSPTYPLYDTEPTGSYPTHSQSGMSPDLVHGIRAEMSYVGSLPRPQHGTAWLEPINSASVPQQNAQVISPDYPLTPAESTRSYSLLGQSPHNGLSYERALPNPGPLSGPSTLPSQGRETPPLSAASHRSSHTWTTDSLSNGSSASSRNSCGASQDFTAARVLTTCEDRASIYTYQAEQTSPQLNAPILPQSIMSEGHENRSEAQAQNTRMQEMTARLHNRASFDSLRTSSPSMYSYPTRPSTRRPHGRLPHRLMTSFGGNALAIGWDRSPSSALSTHESATSQTAMNDQDESTDGYTDCTKRGSVSVLGSTY